MNFNLTNSIILTGILQGFFFGVVYLTSKKYKNKSSFYLALLILTFSYNNLQFYLSDVGLITGNQMYKTIYLPLGSLIPVLIWLYVREFTSASKLALKHTVLYLLPFFLFLSNVLIYKIWPFIAPMTDSIYQKFKLINDIQSVFSAFYTIFLIGLSYFHIRHFEKYRQKNQKRVMNKVLWLKSTLVILFALTILWSYALFKYLSNASYRIYFQILWLGLTIAIYWLGHFGIYRYSILEERRVIRKKRLKSTNGAFIENHRNEHITKFEVLLNEKRKYLKHNLTLEEIAQDLNLSKGHLSRIINTHLQTNFSEYVNKLRVEESKKLLIDPEFSNYTLVAIGLEAGFSSKSNFNSVFKKTTGYTPSQFKKEKSN